MVLSEHALTNSTCFRFSTRPTVNEFNEHAAALIAKQRTARKDWYGFPPDAVAIGENGGGDLLVLIPMPEHPDTLQHSVYWWDHETGEIELVADDFSDLPKT